MVGKRKSRPDWQIALAMTGALRVFYLAVASASLPFLHPDPVLIHSNELTENLPVPYGLHYALLGIWERFDTLWYLRIAKRGYDLPMAVIFYPLYPAALRLVSGLILPLAAALLVSTVAAFFSFWGLLRLVESERAAGDRIYPPLVLAVWPSSFVLFSGYAESLTLSLIVWAVVWARDSRWGLATLCRILAGLTRPSGVLGAIPLFPLAYRIRPPRS